MRRKRVALLLCALGAAALCLATAVLCYKADWCYVASDWAKHLLQRPVLERAGEQELLEYTPEELLALPGTELEQSLLLINEAHPIPADFAPEVEVYGDDGPEMNACLTGAYAALSAQIREEYGEKLYITSAFRTMEEQEVIAMENSSEIAAAVGESEHQAGLALDVCVTGYGGSAFLKSPVGQYVNDEAWRCGFIIRYPYYGTEQTGISYEPWHLRYVGQPHAEIISRNRWTLEEYIAALEEDVYYASDGWLVSRQQGPTLLVPAQYESLLLSEDNCGGWIITVRE